VLCATALLVGTINFEWLALPQMLLALFLGILLSFLILILIASIAFWVEDVTAIFWIYAKLILFMAGTIMPLDLLPDTVRNVMAWTPMIYTMYKPVRLFIHYNTAEWIGVIAMQLVWLAAIGFATWFVMRRGLRKVSMHGG